MRSQQLTALEAWDGGLRIVAGANKPVIRRQWSLVTNLTERRHHIEGARREKRRGEVRFRGILHKS